MSQSLFNGWNMPASTNNVLQRVRHNMSLITTGLALAALLGANLPAAAQQPTDYVNPLIGTNGMGHVFPGACTPFGWVQLSPDTDTIPHNVDGVYQKGTYAYCAGYRYQDSTIVGFSHTHLSGTGHSDLGDLLLMPATGPLKLNPGRADHPDEGYRSRFSHATEKAAPGYYEVMLDDYGIRAQLTATQRVGIHKYTFPEGEKGHLILDLVHGIYNYDGKVLWSNLRVENDTLLTGYRITNGWARTNYTYFAISFSQPIRDYGYQEKGKTLYNGFWRRFAVNRNFPEMGGRKVVAYFNFDTDRQSELVVKVALSATSTAGALKNLQAEAAQKSFGQLAAEAGEDWTIYQTALKAGNEEVARTYRERALNYRNLFDPSIGFARPKLKDGSFKPDFDVLQTHGEGFIEGNSWNFSFHVPHDVAGLIPLMGGEKVFIDKLDKLFTMHLPKQFYEQNEDITEACLVGGYVHGNEPSHHIPYLYAWTSQPWKTQYWLREILNKMYRNATDGLGGNDDCGQMSAWYIFSVMGFYPVCPGTDQYVLGAPYLPYLKLKLPNGKTLEIKAPGVSDKKRYVRSLKINGTVYDKMYITHEDLMKGGVFEFSMSSSPNKRRGLSAQDKPYSLTQ